MKRNAMTADNWNATYPVGTKVEYHSIIGEPEHIKTETRTPAWTLGHGEPVVSVNGISGGVCFDALVIIKD
jgi:hypothetical protein